MHEILIEVQADGVAELFPKTLNAGGGFMAPNLEIGIDQVNAERSFVEQSLELLVTQSVSPLRPACARGPFPNESARRASSSRAL